MRTTRNIEQVFSKIKSINNDIRYKLITRNFRQLPNFEEIYKDYYKENKYVNWKTMNKFNNNPYFIEKEKRNLI